MLSLSLIPEAKQDAVTRALQAAFGVSEVDEIRLLTAGLSAALVFRIVVRGCARLLRVIVNTGAAIGPGRGDQTHHYVWMRAGADAGIAPRVWYTSAEDGVSITDFVEARPFPRLTALSLLPSTIRKLHTLAAFPPRRTVNYLEAMDGLMRRFQAAALLPPNTSAELFDLYARLRDVYPHDDSGLVPSHNDLKPENILFDGERVWLVDWEAAFLNDRYLDLTVVANFVVTNDAEEESYLRTYFGEAAGEYRRARFYLMAQLLHMFYVGLLMLIGCKGRSLELTPVAPDFRDFHDRILAGDLSLADDGKKLEYAIVHLERVFRNARTERFRESLRIVSAARMPAL